MIDELGGILTPKKPLDVLLMDCRLTNFLRLSYSMPVKCRQYFCTVQLLEIKQIAPQILQQTIQVYYN